MKTNKNITNDYELTDAELDDLMAEIGIAASPRCTNSEWIKALESRLERQRREFASLLDHAAEKPGLLRHCHEMRREIEATKHQLADCRYLQNERN
jgi:hypothetical protein